MPNSIKERNTANNMEFLTSIIGYRYEIYRVELLQYTMLEHTLTARKIWLLHTVRNHAR